MKFLETYLAQPILCIFGLSLFVACWTMACAVTAHHQNEFRTLTQPNSIRCSSVHIFCFCVFFFTFYLALTFVWAPKIWWNIRHGFRYFGTHWNQRHEKTTKIKLNSAWFNRIALNQWKNHWKCYFDWLKFI